MDQYISTIIEQWSLLLPMDQYISTIIEQWSLLLANVTIIGPIHFDYY